MTLMRKVCRALLCCAVLCCVLCFVVSCVVPHCVLWVERCLEGVDAEDYEGGQPSTICSNPNTPAVVQSFTTVTDHNDPNGHLIAVVWE